MIWVGGGERGPTAEVNLGGDFYLGVVLYRLFRRTLLPRWPRERSRAQGSRLRVLRRADRGVFQLAGAVFHNPVADLMDHLFQKKAQMAAGPEVRGRNVTDAVRVGGELVAFSKRGPAGVLGVVHSDGVASVLAHHREAGDVSGAVPDVDHVVKGDGAHARGHVVVHVLGHGEKSLIDAKQVLGFLGVGDDPLGKGDAAAGVLGVFAAKNALDVGGEAAAFDENLQPA